MKRTEIIKAAFMEFSKNSYDNSSINNIIKESNTSKGTFYHYFKSKEDLYSELANIVLMKKIEYFQDSNLGGNDIGGDIFQLFKVQVKKSVDFSIDNQLLTDFSIQIRREPNESVKEKILKKMGDVSKEYYYVTVKENIDKGVIRNDFPIEFTVDILAYMLTHFMEFLLTTDCKINKENKEQITESFNYYIDFIEKGLRKAK